MGSASSLAVKYHLPRVLVRGGDLRDGGNSRGGIVTGGTGKSSLRDSHKAAVLAGKVTRLQEELDTLTYEREQLEKRMLIVSRERSDLEGRCNHLTLINDELEKQLDKLQCVADQHASHSINHQQDNAAAAMHHANFNRLEEASEDMADCSGSGSNIEQLSPPVSGKSHLENGVLSIGVDHGIRGGENISNGGVEKGRDNGRDDGSGGAIGKGGNHRRAVVAKQAKVFHLTISTL